MVKTRGYGIVPALLVVLLVWAVTGDWRIGAVVALVEPLVNRLGYRLNQRRDRRRGCQGGPPRDGALTLR